MLQVIWFHCSDDCDFSIGQTSPLDLAVGVAFVFELDIGRQYLVPTFRNE
jgi:hypothetical protein